MKTVYSTVEVPRLWARAAQRSARNSRGSLWFDGPALYSYNTVIAYYVDAFICVVDTKQFSKTTSKHQSLSRRAIRNRASDLIECEGLHGLELHRERWESRLATWLVRDASEKYAQAAEKKRDSHVRAVLVSLANLRLRHAALVIARAPNQRGMKALRCVVDAANGVFPGSWAQRATVLGEHFRAERRRAAVERAKNNWCVARNDALALTMRRRTLTMLAGNMRTIKAIAAETGQRFVRPRGLPTDQQIAALESYLLAEIATEHADRVTRELHAAWRETEQRAHRDLLDGASSFASRRLAIAIDVARKLGIAIPDRVEQLKGRCDRAQTADNASHEVYHLLTDRIRVDDPVGLREWQSSYASCVCSMAEFPASHPVNVLLAGMVGRAVEFKTALTEWDAKHEAREAAAIEEWRAGSRSLVRTTYPVLRLVGDVIESNQGASIPVSAARDLWSYIAAVRGDEQRSAALTRSLRDRRYRVGNYVFDTLRADGSLVIGCHDIPVREVDIIAGLL